jgi:hypothetical protein
MLRKRGAGDIHHFRLRRGTRFQVELAAGIKTVGHKHIGVDRLAVFIQRYGALDIGHRNIHHHRVWILTTVGTAAGATTATGGECQQRAKHQPGGQEKRWSNKLRHSQWPRIRKVM